MPHPSRIIFCVATVLLVASPARAERFEVSFESTSTGSMMDPSGVLPIGWNPISGFGGEIALFTGTWLYESEAVDQIPEPRRGLFVFDDPDLTINLNAGGLVAEYKLETIEFFYSEEPCCDWSWYRVTGSRSPSSFPGIETDGVVLHFAWEGPRNPVTPTDVPDPLPGSPWEDGSGHSVFDMSGTNGGIGENEVTYFVRKTAGSYQDPVPAPECVDGVDNDGDLLTDFPVDPGCRYAVFPTENPECDDGIDNDADTLKDMDDPECVARSDRSEQVNCADGVDNDADGDVDTADLGCPSPNRSLEEPQCSDLVDNDSDGRMDWNGGGVGPGAGDLDCLSAHDNQEKAGPCGLGVELSLLLASIWAVRRRANRRGSRF